VVLRFCGSAVLGSAVLRFFELALSGGLLYHWSNLRRQTQLLDRKRECAREAADVAGLGRHAAEEREVGEIEQRKSCSTNAAERQRISIVKQI